MRLFLLFITDLDKRQKAMLTRMRIPCDSAIMDLFIMCMLQLIYDSPTLQTP